MDEYKLWLEKANDDLRWTRHNFESKEFAGVCFSAQQAVEKSLKAYLLSKKKGLKRTHDVVLLLGDCVKIDRSFGVLKNQVDILFPYYATTRYPFGNELFSFDKKKAKEALGAAEEIINFVETKLS